MRYFVVCFFALLPLFGADLDITMKVQDRTTLSWQPSSLEVEVYPGIREKGEVYLIPSGVILSCSSSLADGWKVYLRSSEVTKNGDFLLHSEDGRYHVRLALARSSGSLLKNGSLVFDVREFFPGIKKVELQPIIYSWELSLVPSGYYTGQISAVFLAE